MSTLQQFREEKRQTKKRTIRRKLISTSTRPRLTVRRTLKHMIAQVVDDAKNVSILQINSSVLETKGKKAVVAKALGKVIAEKLKLMGIDKIVFDRSGYLYHGRIKALADGAREGGLIF